MKIKSLALSLMAVTLGCAVGLGSGLVPVASTDAEDQAKPGGPLPKVFVSVLPELKAKSRVAVLLPTELPRPFEEAKKAVVEKVSANGYGISLFYELDIGDAGLAAYFAADASPSYDPRGLPGLHEVKLARGIRGFFSPVSCGGSCGPANLWWRQAGTLYQIQLKLTSALGKNDQEKTIMSVADSAILAGPR